LVQHFVDAAARKFSREAPGIAPDAMERFQAYPWPGNVRELENCMERLLVLTRGPQVTVDELPAHLREGVEALEMRVNGFELPAAGVRLPDVERHLIRQALRRCEGNLRPAARLLGISYKTLQYRIRKYGLEREVAGGRTLP
jgi:DNA-binding NtrC family response regulator